MRYTIPFLLAACSVTGAVAGGPKFDAKFMKAMNQGENARFLKKVNDQKRKNLWRNLLSQAKPASSSISRELDNNGNNAEDGVDWDNLGFDMTSYSLKYTGCSAVKTYDADKAADQASTVLTTKRFALFRLCPSNNCNQYTVTGCGRNYGEYVLEMDAFLQGIVEFNNQRYWHYCHLCKRCNALENFGQTMANGAAAEQEMYESMEAANQEYYEQQQEQYENEDQQYADEDAQNYNDDANNGGRKLDEEAEEGNDEANDDANTNNNGNNYVNAAAYGWNENVYGEWQDDWNVAWMSFNWRILPYCSADELETCSDADDICSDFSDYGSGEGNEDENVQQDENAADAFSSCTEVGDGYWIAPHCGSDGYTITLGVYQDEYCDEYVGDEVSVSDILGYSVDEDFFPHNCVSCEVSDEELEFNDFVDQDNDFENYENWLDEKWEYYVQMMEQQSDNQEAQQEYSDQQQNYYEYNNYDDANQNGYYYNPGQSYQNGGGVYYGQNYYYGNNYAGTYGSQLMTNGQNYYYDRDTDWMGAERYNSSQYDGNDDIYTSAFVNSGIADVCGALYTYAAKCNTHLYTNGQSSSYGSDNQANNEEQVCNFADNLQQRKYNENGEIVLDESTQNFALSTVDWKHPSTVVEQAKISTTPAQSWFIAITALGCVVMGTWAAVLHRTLTRKNIPWRPRRGKKMSDPTDITRQSSGIVLGRSRSGMSSSRNAPLI